MFLPLIALAAAGGVAFLAYRERKNATPSGTVVIVDDTESADDVTKQMGDLAAKLGVDLGAKSDTVQPSIANVSTNKGSGNGS